VYASAKAVAFAPAGKEKIIPAVVPSSPGYPIRGKKTQENKKSE
jgi:hypothetical protein